MTKDGQTTQPKRKHTPKPKNPKLRCKSYKFRLYPTRKQIGTLEWTLRRCKELYNAALQERREAYQLCGVSISYGMQADQLPALKQLREEYQDIHSQVQQDVLKRLEKAFDAFFRRVMNGQTPGYPRFKSGDRYDSFTYPQHGYEIIGHRLYLSKIGHIKIKLHHEITGKIKTCTIKREGDQWYAIFATEYEFDPTRTFHPSEEAVGIDLGIKTFAVLSTGETIESPRFYRPSEEKIKEAHRKILRSRQAICIASIIGESALIGYLNYLIWILIFWRRLRRKKGSHRRTRAKKDLSRLYRKVRNRRRDFLHQESRHLVTHYGTLVFEDLHIDNMTARPKAKQDEETGKYLPNGAAAKGGLNTSILDASWGQFVALCSHKAEEAGGNVVCVSPKDTSQACSGCSRIVKKDLSVRVHSCPFCGLVLDRDENAAINILARYQEQQPSGAGSVPRKPGRVRSASGTA